VPLSVAEAIDHPGCALLPRGNLFIRFPELALLADPPMPELFPRFRRWSSSVASPVGWGDKRRAELLA
jgi:hypothetical protein